MQGIAGEQHGPGPSPLRGTGLSVRAEGVHLHFRAHWVLAGFDLELRGGEALSLVGDNGSGKTTFLRCLATEIKPHYGAIALDGLDLWEHRRTLRPRISFLSHANRLYDELSAQENLEIWASFLGDPPDVATVLERVGLSTARRDPVGTYSAGMRRRLALARVLLKAPDLALFDEPFSAFDPSGRALVAEVLRDLRDRGTTLVVVSHRRDMPVGFFDRALRIESGRAVLSGESA